MINLDLAKGDIILTGKYRNKREVVTHFGFDDKGQPTVNGRKMLTFRIEKLMKEEIELMKKSNLIAIIKECIHELKEEKYPKGYDDPGPQDHEGPIEIYGVMGMSSKKFTKKFKSQKEFERWMEKNGDDVEILGYR